MPRSTGAPDAADIIGALQAENARLLHERFVRAIEDGDVPAGTSPETLTDYVQTVWQGLSAQSNQGVGRDRLLRAAEIATHRLWE